LKKSLICCALTLLTATMALGDDKKSITAARAAVLGSLKDPASARFEGDVVYPTGAVCGLVNSKNAYGGYVGSTPYFYVIATKELRFLTDGKSRFETEATVSKFEKYCRR